MAIHDSEQQLGPRARRSAERRREILIAASRAFAHRGYPGASLAAIAQDVGISAPSLLHHFRNKETLLTEVLAYRDEVSRSLDAGSPDPQGAAFLDHLVATADANARRPGLTQLYAVLLGESLTADHPATEFFIQRFTGLRRMVRDAVLAAVADDAVSEQSVLETCSAIVAVMDGLQYQFLLAPDTVEMAAVVERSIRALLSELRAETGAKRSSS